MITNEQALVRQFKQALGTFQYLDCTDMDAVSAHRKLGIDVREQAWRILGKRLDDLGDKELVSRQINQAQRTRRALDARLESGFLEPSIREAVEQYRSCLSAWAEGAGLAEFSHPLLAAKTDDHQGYAEDLATLLQEDEVGCQTGSFREQDGSVIFWHTEEDGEKTPGERFDKLRLFSFRAWDDQVASGFIYPDLLPGPSFAWRGGNYLQAIDTLHVKAADLQNAILPNTLAWISLFLGRQVSLAKLAQQLGPFRGGYSISAASKKNERVGVEKVEFANDALYASQLDQLPGSHTFQTNIIRDLSLPIGGEEQTSLESRLFNVKRLERTERFLQVIQTASETLPLIFRMLRSRLGGDAAYANHDVKAYIICHMASEKTRTWVGTGAPLPDDHLFYMETGALEPL